MVAGSCPAGGWPPDPWPAGLAVEPDEPDELDEPVDADDPDVLVEVDDGVELVVPLVAAAAMPAVPRMRPVANPPAA
jgi:hypothetical protein